MAYAGTKFGDISQRTAAWVVKELLEASYGMLILEQFGEMKPLPANTADSMKFRRYLALPSTPTTLTEGETPTPGSMTHEDITVSLAQYGYLLTFSDKVMDMNEDPILKEATKLLGRQAAEMIENVRWGHLLAGTNVFYSTGAARTAVVDKLSKALQRKVIRKLQRQHAPRIQAAVAASPNYSTFAVNPTYIGITHTDMVSDIRDMEGFIDVKDYGSAKPLMGEVGAVEDVRYLVTTLCPIFAGGGGSSTTVVNSSGKVDVYPVLYLGERAWASVPFKGANAITPTVVNASPSDSDPLAQRTHVGWKSYTGTVILNDAWMARAEVACSL